MPLSAVFTLDLSGNPLVTMTISGVTGSTITISRQWDGQRAPIRGGRRASVLGSVMIGQDWEAPFGIPVTYLIECHSGAGVLLESWQSGPLTIPVAVPWLSDPLSPAASCSVVVEGESMRSMTYGREGSVVGILGSSLPVAVVNTRQAASNFSLSFIVADSTERRRVLDILQQADPALVRLPADWDPLPPLAYVTADAVVDVDTDRHAGGTRSVLRMDCTLVAAKSAGIIVPPRTYADLPEEGSTYVELAARYPTYADMQKG